MPCHASFLVCERAELMVCRLSGMQGTFTLIIRPGSCSLTLRRAPHFRFQVTAFLHLMNAAQACSYMTVLAHGSLLYVHACGRLAQGGTYTLGRVQRGCLPDRMTLMAG